MRRGPIVMLLLLVALAAGAVRAFSPTPEPERLIAFKTAPGPMIVILREAVEGSEDLPQVFQFFPRPWGQGEIVIDLHAGEVRLYGIYKGNPPRAAMALSELFGEVCGP